MVEKFILAVPKGRILEELTPVLQRANIIPDDNFFNEHCRSLRFTTNYDHLDIIRVRSSDVATFVAYGSAALGVAGKDVLMEYNHDAIYAPLNLNIGKCRMALAAEKEFAQNINLRRQSHIRVATKYPKITQSFFQERGIQAECIKLNGAMELAPSLGLCRCIVDLVSTGSTLKANGLQEVETITNISSYLIVNRFTYKTHTHPIQKILDAFSEALHG